MKKYSFIFSILLLLILIGASCVSAADLDESNSSMLDDGDIGLSQGDNADLISDDEILENDNDQLNHIETNSDDDLLEEPCNNIASVDELVLEDNSALAVSNLPDVIVPGGNLKDLSTFISYMQMNDGSAKEELRQKLELQYGISIPKEHSNTLCLNGNYNTISDKLIISITSGRNITIDGQGHTIDLAGSDHHDHYFVVKCGDITFKNIVFTNGYNNDGDNGGAISFENNGTGTIINCTFKNCWAKDTGGAIADRSGISLTIINSTFIGNEANKHSGGAVWSKGKLLVINSTFDSNKANEHGGGLYCKGYMLVDGCSFKNNNASLKVTTSGGYGGGLYANDLELTNAPIYFENNHAGCGGGMSAERILSNISNAIFIGNSATERGGAIFTNTGGDLTISACVFINNRLTSNRGGSFGGAVDLEGSNLRPVLKNNVFVDNFAYTVGNHVYTYYTLTADQNWYGSNNPIFSSVDFSSYDFNFEDSDYLVVSYNITPKDDQFEFELSFKTKSGKVPDNPLYILNDFVSFECDGEKLVFENITVEGIVIRATAIPKEYGSIPFTLKIYDIPVVKDYIIN